MIIEFVEQFQCFYNFQGTDLYGDYSDMVANYAIVDTTNYDLCDCRCDLCDCYYGLCGEIRPKKD